MVSSKGNVETRFAALGRSTSRLGTLCGVFAMLMLATGCDPCLNSPCDDGVFCNGAEVCTASGSSFTCAAGTAVMCDPGMTCDEAASACVDPCAGVDCDDMNPCTTDTCDAGVCSNVDPGCDDGDACTENDACDPADGSCAGTAVDCGAGMQCDPMDGSCIGAGCALDSDCDDMSACTTDTCDTTTMLCVFAAVDCNDMVNCTIDTCDATTGCMNTATVCPAGESCNEADGTCGAVTCATDADCPDDGLFCNGTESCDTTTLVCTSSGNPCPMSTTCNDTTNTCDNAGGNETIALTTGNDTPVATSADTLFDAQLFLTSGGTFVQTIGSADSLDGVAGNNTLTMQTNSATTIAPASLKNIQTVNIQNTVNATNLNAVNADAITEINSTNSVANVIVTGLQTKLTKAGVTNTGTNNLSVTMTDMALTGTADSLTFNVSGATGGTHTFQPTTAATNGYETITVASNGGVANILTDLLQGNGNSWATLNVTGDQNLTITSTAAPNTLPNTVVTVDASGAAGKVNVKIGNGITTTTGGSGDDTFTFPGTNYVRASDTVAGGMGSDTLAATSGQLTGTTANVSLVTDIETLSVTDGLAANLNVTHYGAVCVNVNLAGTTGARTVTLGSGGLVKISAATVGNLTFAASPNTNSDALTVELSANTGAGLLATTFENLTVEAKTAARTITGATTLANTANAESVTVLGSQNLTFTGVITADSVNASGMTGTAFLTITAAMSGASVITGGPGNDLLTESTGNDIVDGGGGNDTISIRAGNDSITGGAGNDSIVFIDAANDTTNDAGTNNIADFSFGATSDTMTFDASGLGTLNGGAQNPVTTANYFEGAIASMTAATAYSVVVITDQGYASSAVFETALAAQSTSLTDAIVVFFNTTTSRAELYVDDSLGADSGIAAADKIVTFDNVTTLAGMAQFANTDFIFGA